MIKLLTFFHDKDEQKFLNQLAQAFDYLFDLTVLKDGTMPNDFSSYQGQVLLDRQATLNLPSIKLSLKSESDSFALPNLQLDTWPSDAALQLAAFLTRAIQDFDNKWLDGFPLHAALFNTKNELIYHNQKPKDAFLFEQLDTSPLADWQMKAFETTPNHISHILLPSISFDQILVESSHGLYQQEQLQGVFQQVWDIKPLLATYLEETGQAIVGWSDVTSGASIKNSLFEDEF